MKNGEKIKRIIWAVNPFDEEMSSQEYMVKVLSQVAESIYAAVEPVSVAYFEPRSGAYTVEEFESYVAGLLEDFLEKNPIPYLKKSKVIGADTPTNNGAVQALSEYARSEKADLIAVCTQGRKGLPRLFLGSFAETLLLNSELPILTVGPKINVIRPIQNILFATDFKEGSKRTFNYVLSLAKSMKARLTVFHALQPIVVPYGSGWVPDENFFRELEESTNDVAKMWVTDAEAKGVSAQFKILSNVTSVSEEIISFAKDKSIDMVALSAQSGAFEASLLGSIARQVVRGAPCPVLVMRASQNT